MNVKLCDLKALESVTIAAYGIPETIVLASKAKFTNVAGKNNCFISGSPSQAMDRDLEALWGLAHRISCTYSFSMSEKGYEGLVDTMLNHPEFTQSTKYNKKYHRVFYVNKRKFTISYFNKKCSATVYASNELFDTELAFLFDKQWGEPMDKKVKGINNKKQSNENKIDKKKSMAVPTELTALPVVEEVLRLPKPESNWTVQSIRFRINRIVITGENLSLNAVKQIKAITDKSNNSVSLKTENRGPGKRKQAVTLTSNINTYLVEAIDVVKAESPLPMTMEFRIPIKSAHWEYICENNWIEDATIIKEENGIKLVLDGQNVVFKRSANTGVCEMKGQDSDLLRECAIRLDAIFENNFGDRKIEKESIDEVIRKKIPYTIKVLKEQAEPFINLIAPSFVLLNDSEIELTDYSPMVFSVYRGVELYLKYLADLSGIDLANQSVGKLFKTAGRQKHQYLEMINDSLKGEILQSVFENFSNYRNALFHANLDNVIVISSRQAAEDICVSVLQNLESASFQFHLEEMTIII